jgi:hypothetical protein
MFTLTEDRGRAVKMTAEATNHALATKCAPTVNIYFYEKMPVLNFAESSRKFVSSGARRCCIIGPGFCRVFGAAVSSRATSF